MRFSEVDSRSERISRMLALAVLATIGLGPVAISQLCAAAAGRGLHPVEVGWVFVMWASLAALLLALVQNRHRALRAAEHERRRTRDAVEGIAEATAAAIGSDFFESLVRHLAASLNVRHVAISEIVSERDRLARTLAFWSDGEPREPLEYFLDDGPCGETVRNGEHCELVDAQVRHPDCRLIRELGARAYMGTVLRDAEGRELGLLFVLHDRAPAHPEEARILLRIVAVRAAAELARLRSERELRQSRMRAELLGGLAASIRPGMGVGEVISLVVQRLHVTFDRFRVAYGTVSGDGKIRVVESAEPEGMPRLRGSSADLTRAPGYLLRLRRGEPVVVRDVRESGELRALAPEMLARCAASMLDVPLHHAEGLCGLLCLDSPTPQEWTDHEIATLREAASLLEVAIREAAANEERERAERELRDNEERLGRIYESATDGVVVVDPESRAIVEANPSAVRMFGFPQERLIGMRIDELHPDDLPDALAFLRRVVERGRAFTDRLRIRTGAGRLLYVEISSSSFVLRGRTLVLGIVRDVTRHRGSERAFRAVVEGTASVTGDGFFRSLTTHLAGVLGVRYALVAEFRHGPVPRVRALAAHGDDRLAALDRRVSDSDLFGHLARGATQRIEEGLGDAFPGDALVGGLGAVSYLGTPLIGTGGHVTGVIAVIHDEPMERQDYAGPLLRVFGARAAAELERTRAERQLTSHAAELTRTRDQLENRSIELAENTEALERARREAEAASSAKSQFLANMSHELRTPLGAILGYADLILDEDASIEDARSHARTIRRNGDHLLALISDILDLSRIEARRMSIERIECSPGEIVRDIVSLMKPRADGRGIALEADIGADVPERVLSDPTRLRQIMVNLIGNALKFTERGSVRVVVSREDGSSGDLLRFEVIDTGIGITDDQLSRLFRPFTQADPSMNRRFGGTGLGLAISRELARMLGGGIDVRSEPGEGSTFIVRISLELPEEAGAGSPSRREGTAHAGHGSPAGAPRAAAAFSARILLAEDGADNRRLLAHYLTKGGARVDVVEDGRQAVDRVLREERGGRAFDLILMDMQMPVLDGYRATRRLREAGITTPILALTAHAREADRERCLGAGCDEYLAKPVERAALIEACLSLLEDRRELRAQVGRESRERGDDGGEDAAADAA